MNAEIVNRQDAQVLGIIARINPSEADYDDLWHRRFDPREPEVNRLAIDPGYVAVYYGTGQPDLMDFVAGMIVGDVTEVPEGLVLRALPGGMYAAFSCTLANLSDTWRAIFRLAQRLDVQVMATSHSWDAIEAFQKAAGEDPEEGVLIRLSRRGDDIIPTLFREDELAVATRDRIEVR